MPETTVDKVRGIASHLKKVSDTNIDTYISDAVLELEGYSYDDKYQEKLERYLAAHFATLDHPKPTSKDLDGLGSHKYPDRTGKEGLKLTEYGQEVLRVLKKQNGPTFMVLS